MLWKFLRVWQSNGLVLVALRSLKWDKYYWIIILEVLRKVTEYFVVKNFSLYLGWLRYSLLMPIGYYEMEIWQEFGRVTVS